MLLTQHSTAESRAKSPATQRLLIVALAYQLLGGIASGRTFDDFEQGAGGWHFWTPPAAAGQASRAFGVYSLSVPIGKLAQPVYSVAINTAEVLVIGEAETVELRVAVLDVSSDDVFAGLAWIPESDRGSSGRGYIVAKSGSEVRVGKSVGQWFLRRELNADSKGRAVTLVLSLSAASGAVSLRVRLLEKQTGTVLFDAEVLDDEERNNFVSGIDDPAAPMLGRGRFALLAYAEAHNGNNESEWITFDDAEASTAAPENLIPSIEAIVPPVGSPFLPIRTEFSFLTIDDEPWEPRQGRAGWFDGPFAVSAVGIIPNTDGKAQRVSTGGSLIANRTYSARLLSADAHGAGSTAMDRRSSEQVTTLRIAP